MHPRCCTPIFHFKQQHHAGDLKRPCILDLFGDADYLSIQQQHHSCSHW